MVPFFPVYGWVGIWSCMFLLGLGALEASSEVVSYYNLNFCCSSNMVNGKRILC
jgi:hypothetical protein